MWFLDTDNVVRIEGLRSVKAAAGVYITDATIKGILYKLPVLNPAAGDVLGPLVVGDGKVGIPFVEHGLLNGDSIRLERFLNYNGDYLLQEGTTDSNQLVINAATYTAEELTGREFIYVAIVGKVDAEIAIDPVEGIDGDYVGTIPYDAPLLQDEDYMLCVKTVLVGTGQVLAKIMYRAGYQGM